MNAADVVAFLKINRLATLATSAVDGSPQSAVVGVATLDGFEVVFDTLASTRKVASLRRDPRVAITWWEGERTVQYEGIADEPHGAERERCVAAHLAAFPDGLERQSWPGLLYFRVRPAFVRWSDFSNRPPIVQVVVAGRATA